MHGRAADVGGCCKGATWVRFPKTGAARSRRRRVERADGEFAPRQRAPLIVIDGGEPRDRTRIADAAAYAVAHAVAHPVAACAPHAHEIDLRRGDAAGERELLGAGVRPGDLPRQRSDVACIRGIVAHRPAQAVAARVLGRARPARGGDRPPAPACIGAVGDEPPRSGHAVRLAGGRGYGCGCGDIGQGGVLDLRHRAPQRGRKAGAMTLDLAQHVAAAVVRPGGHALDALDGVDLERERARHRRVHVQSGRGQHGIDLHQCLRVAGGPSRRDLIGRLRAEQRAEHHRQALVRRRRQELRLEAAQPQRLPGEVDDVAHPDLLKNVGRREHARHAGAQVVVGGGVLARDQRGGREERQGGARTDLRHGRPGGARKLCLGHALLFPLACCLVLLHLFLFCSKRFAPILQGFSEAGDACCGA